MSINYIRYGFDAFDAAARGDDQEGRIVLCVIGIVFCGLLLRIINHHNDPIMHKRDRFLWTVTNFNASQSSHAPLFVDSYELQCVIGTAFCGQQLVI